MLKHQIKSIVTDLDGVIRHFPAHRDSEIEHRYGLPLRAISEAAFEPTLLSQVVVGKITDETWRCRILDALSKRHPDRNVMAAIQEWSAYSGTVDMETLHLLKRTSPSPLALLTNATTRLASDLERLRIHSAFGLILNSSTLGVAKPDASIFEITCSTLKLPPHEILFIDDSEKNVLAANSIGMHGITFSDRGKLEEYLLELGLQ